MRQIKNIYSSASAPFMKYLKAAQRGWLSGRATFTVSSEKTAVYHSPRWHLQMFCLTQHFFNMHILENHRSFALNFAEKSTKTVTLVKPSSGPCEASLSCRIKSVACQFSPCTLKLLMICPGLVLYQVCIWNLLTALTFTQPHSFFSAYQEGMCVCETC